MGEIWTKIGDFFVDGLGKNAFFRALSFGLSQACLSLRHPFRTLGC
jgi:hypothetical protein